METVSVRDLRNHGGDVLNRVIRGEGLVVTRDGVEVAELRRVQRVRVSASELIARRQTFPTVDPHGLRADLDATIDVGL